MAESFTGIIDSEGAFVLLEDKTSGFTFTAGKTYTMQLQNKAYLKISNAEFFIPTYVPFTYKASEDDLYIKTVMPGTVVVILENAEEE